MELAKIYRINHQRYKYLVRFRKKGFKEYSKHHYTKAAAIRDRDDFNRRMLSEGREGITIGPRERKVIEDLIIACEERGVTVRQVIEMVKGMKPKGGHLAEDVLFSLIELRERQGRSIRTIQNLRHQCRSFFKHSRQEYIERMGRDEILEFVFSAGMPRSQISRYAALTNLYNHAVKLGVLEKSPLDSIERPKKPRSTGASIFMPEEAETFLRRLEAFEDGRLTGYFALLIFGGLRPSEALALRDSDIGEGSIYIDGGKMAGRARRRIKISSQLKAWLNAYPLPVGLREDSKILIRARQLSPVNWVQDICRHTYASSRLALTNDEKLVGREMGTNPDTIYNSYHEAISNRMARKYTKILPTSK